ncbi:3-hydroxyacyl-CoA dehydrogenase family protein [Streptomyces lancefieldiae]|uniref:3-hydroxyacyl-CoA dehydrogenase family protein n=1 Tax=Streptomyces lancefieldiae TaxID=3075520 RepID=A0ABU3APX2_9ACTN|nr:3-hydroxyacyl-CoA dehydrogenase family protein [Streptomyces sp. DSM 40712]MDT0612237.1 3-hydroxyacyl-CoA dehydrogenase family protein [Streptomyces sp. DSM 40712]
MATDHQQCPVAVIGAGVMGTAIATTVLGSGLPVVLLDVGQAELDRAERTIEIQLRHARMMDALPSGRAPGRLVTTTSSSALAGARAVVEAVVEHEATKVGVLTDVAGIVDADTPLISNTSGIPIDTLADPLPRPQQLIGTHFMNPAYLIDLVEVIRGRRTDEATVTAVTELLAALNRRAVVVRDSPGFVTSRLLHPMLNDAARLVDEDVATAEDVDRLMVGCLGHRTGPLRTADLIGLDNLVDSLAALYERTGEQRYRPCEQLLAKVHDGHLGQKSGRGFYDYREALS